MYRKIHVMPNAFLQIALLCLSLAGVSFHSLAAPNVEETFLQGQRQLAQGNIAQANVKLAQLPSQSAYAKLLAGNIAAQQGDIDQAFLLLLPLQSNTQLIRPAAASLHASLGSAYEKQGAYFNALAQLTRHEIYLDDSAAITDNHAHIWRLLSTLTTENLVELRGESIDSVTQGWIDLSLAAKQQNQAEGLATWADSYPDHPAFSLAKTLVSAPAEIDASLSNNAALSSSVQSAPTLKEVAIKEGVIALILPFDHTFHKAHAEAFKLGLETALAHQSLSNEIKLYSTLGDQESFADLYALAKDEGATYFIGPMTNEELNPQHANMQTLTLLDSHLPSDQHLQHAGYSLQDEAEAIANFASRKAIQRIAILASERELALKQALSFGETWKTKSDIALTLVPLPNEVNYISLLNLKDDLAANQNEMVILALSAAEAAKVKPYLDISVPTIGFSSINERMSDEKNNALLAIRFVDIPFLADKNNADFGVYREASASLTSNALLRWFALGVDYLGLLAAKTNAPGSEVIIHGLTGTLLIDANGQIKRQLPLAIYTANGAVIGND